jgi:hypothetical protein
MYEPYETEMTIPGLAEAAKDAPVSINLQGLPDRVQMSNSFTL